MNWPVYIKFYAMFGHFNVVRTASWENSLYPSVSCVPLENLSFKGYVALHLIQIRIGIPPAPRVNMENWGKRLRQGLRCGIGIGPYCTFKDPADD